MLPEDPQNKIEDKELEADNLEESSDDLEESPQNISDNSEIVNSQTAETTVKKLDDQKLQQPKNGLFFSILSKLNVYLLLLVFLVMFAIILVLIGYFGVKSNINQSTLVSQNLSPASLKQIASNDTNVGSSSEVLNIASSTIFSGNILAKGQLQVAGNLTVGGTVALNNLSTSGTGQFGQLNVSKNLLVSGNSSIQGNETISQSLQVNGSASFGGAISATQITTSGLALNGDLTIEHHIDTSGSIPSIQSKSPIGIGGTVSISGNDTAGNIVVNSGTNSASGCFVNITFSSPFNKTVAVEITPVGPASGGLAYYVTQSNTGFSICDASSLPVSSSFGFNYFVVD
jgi:cytoskeletal protein CcmA (bactofilin family)